MTIKYKELLYQAVEIPLAWPPTALKLRLKCSFTGVNSTFSLNFVLYPPQVSKF